MNVSSISANTNPYGSAAYGSSQGSSQQLSADFKQLTQAIQSGDLTTAQRYYQALTQNSNITSSNNPLSQDFQTLGQALQSGNVSSAQQALTNLQSDASNLRGSQGATQTGSSQSTHRGGHHHHHHVESDSDSEDTVSLSSTASSAASSTSSSGTGAST